MSDPIINNQHDDRVWCEAARTALHAYVRVDPRGALYSHAELSAADADALLAERAKRMAPPVKPEKPAWRCETCRWWKLATNATFRICTRHLETGAADYGYVGECGPDFGCIHWEAKP